MRPIDIGPVSVSEDWGGADRLFALLRRSAVQDWLISRLTRTMVSEVIDCIDLCDGRKSDRWQTFQFLCLILAQARGADMTAEEILSRLEIERTLMEVIYG